MRPDQRERLSRIAESLADVMLDEIDPAMWPGANKPQGEWDKAIRGDRVWMKKNANATMTLLLRIEQLRAVEAGEKPGGPADDPEDEEARLITKAEAAADELLRKVGKSAAAR